MVRIHGNWCGPNWTAGKALPANDPRVDWSVMPTDALDAACKPMVAVLLLMTED